MHQRSLDLLASDSDPIPGAPTGGNQPQIANAYRQYARYETPTTRGPRFEQLVFALEQARLQTRGTQTIAIAEKDLDFWLGPADSVLREPISGAATYQYAYSRIRPRDSVVCIVVTTRSDGMRVVSSLYFQAPSRLSTRSAN